MKRPLYAAVFVSVLLGQFGCSSLVHQSSKTYQPLVSSDRVLMTEVPFVVQADDQCGPAALDMVLSHVDHSPGLKTLTEWVFSPDRQGSLQPFMVGGVRRSQAVAYEIRGFPALLQELAAGHAVVVLQNQGLSWFPFWHYAVIIGYDLTESRIFLHTGAHQQQSMDWSRFASTWQRGNNWGLVALPHGVLPASLGVDPVFLAIAATESTARLEQLETSYLALLNRWPSHLQARLGLANLYYQTQRLDSAQHELIRAAVIHPKSDAVRNNLATIYFEAGDLVQAHHHARVAVELAGKYQSYAQQTLDDVIEQMRLISTKPTE